jgi:hypothetical protein
LSLSNVKYYNSGNNLLGSDSNNFFALNDYKTAFDKNGCVIIKGKPISFLWYNNKLKSTSIEENPELLNLHKRVKGYSTLLELDIQKQLLQGK